MNLKKRIGLLATCSLMCASTAIAVMKETITMQYFGMTKDGQPTTLYTLTNQNGVKADITNYGGTVTRLLVPDREGKMDDIVLGYNTVAEYIVDSPFFGAIIGRYGNRIANGKFSIDGKEYTLPKNDFPGDIGCSLHGGTGFDKKVWDATPVIENGTPGLKLHYVSKDGEEGYPGKLDVTVCYWLTNNDELKITYEASTDKTTHVNLTNHSYFNLKGEGNGDILGHVLMLTADKFTPVNKGLIPTGELKAVKDTPFDFTTPHAIGERVNTDDAQINFGLGYDHNWVLNNQDGDLALAATVYEPTSGRFMEVYTEEPGIQFYCGNFLDGHYIGKSGRAYGHRSGLCLETQHYPDTPNQDNFPTTLLKPGEVYKTTTIYKFSTK